MTRRRLALALTALCALGLLAANPASADEPQPKTHVLCVGGNSSNGPFEGVCVWAPLPF